MKKRRNRRWRLFADLQLQGPLVLRVAVYWVVCQFAMVATILLSSVLSGQGGDGAISGWQMVLPAIVVSALVLPLVLFDVIAYSNRFAGPLSRFRRCLHQLSETGDSPKINFRPRDFYGDLAEDFNRLLERGARASTVLNEDPRSMAIPDNAGKADCEAQPRTETQPLIDMIGIDRTVQAELGQNV